MRRTLAQWDGRVDYCATILVRRIQQARKRNPNRTVSTTLAIGRAIDRATDKLVRTVEARDRAFDRTMRGGK